MDSISFHNVANVEVGEEEVLKLDNKKTCITQTITITQNDDKKFRINIFKYKK